MDRLREKAERAGVLLGYHDVHGRWVEPDPQALRAILGSLGETALPKDEAWPEDLPRAAFHPEPGRRDWGFFLPHHALRTASTRGIGDLTALGHLGRWAAEQGARVLGTLPLLPTFLHADPGPYEPSPYAPVSRIFWGEHLVDPTATPEWEDCPEAQQILDTARHDGTLERLRGGPHVRPRAAWELQWRLLTALSKVFWDPDSPRRRDGLGVFVRHGGLPASELLYTYAWFRAATQTRGPWPTWPDAHRRFEDKLPHGSLRRDVFPDVDESLMQIWAYAQYTAQVQVRRLGRDLAGHGIDLYLDLPIGTHPDGFDTWYGTGHEPLHAAGVSAGAPPDPFFTSGQDWGFPPVHPHVSARTAHRDLRDALLHHASVAPRLRIDHILGFYRLFWIPRGLGAARGVYVRYPATAWWRTLVDVSHRTGCQMIGENLGMVPDALTAALAEHRIAGMHVAQYSLNDTPRDPVRLPLAGDLSCLNTHDMPTFAGWWTGRDLEIQEVLGWTVGHALQTAQAERDRMVQALAPLASTGPLASRADPESVKVAAALYETLARSEAGTVLVNLEDLWDEREPHNVPGTWRERPNWLRRADRDLQAITSDPAIAAMTAALRDLRPVEPS